jgi:uncharacterized membrane protein YgdD (TMEM256/DUF423 family)
MSNQTAIRISAAFRLFGVVLGAFGADALKSLLAQNQTAGIWEKAVFYHFIHTVMLFVLARRWPQSRFSWFAFAVGIIIFSGSLYLLAVTNLKWLGAITPIGGVSFMAGWVCLILSAGKNESARPK